MSSCGSTSISTKLKSSRNDNNHQDSIIAKKQDGKDIENIENSKSYSSNDILKVPKTTVFICERNSSNHLEDYSFPRFKQRSCGELRNEIRMARGGISSERGRGGSGSSGGSKSRAFKKTVDQDANADSCYSHPPSRPKFQESLKNQENKYCDDKKINEDSRISKLLRRLSREDDYDNFLVLCKQLQEGIVAPENQRYIKRNLDVICDNLLDIMHGGFSLDTKHQITKCLGYLGYIADQDFKRFMDWLFNKYSAERKDDIKCLLMKSFGETLKLDMEAPKYKDHSMAMMSQLQSALENVDRPELLIATVDSILLITDVYPECFTDHFRDTVDILVGWHIDSTQQKSIISYASRSLQRLRNFWIADLQFTLTLLGQFLEDMESYDEELSLPGSGRSSSGEEDAIPCPRDCILRITSLISVFNTVLKCIEDHMNPTSLPNIQWSFLMDCLLKMLKTVVKALELDDGIEIFNDNELGLSQENTESITRFMKNMNLSQKSIDTLLKNLNKDDEINEAGLAKLIKSLNLRKCGDRKNIKFNDKETISKDKEESLINLLKFMDLRHKKSSDLSQEKEELIVVANECTYLLLGHLQNRVSKSHDILYKFIDLQIQRVNIFWDDTIISMLNTISKVVREVSANLPLDLVHSLLGKNSELVNLRFRSNIGIQNAVLNVYHSLLSLKNIPLLQEAYRYVLGDLENAYNTIMPLTEPLIPDNPLTDLHYQRRHAELVLIFLLRAVSEIANASNSIIGMWALKPSILELLAVKMKPHDVTLSIESPLLQYHILFLLYNHCSRYNHFVPSSNLITGASACRPLDLFPGTLEVPTVSPTSGHLSVILSLIVKIIENEKLPKQTLLLQLNWIQEIFVQAENYIGKLSKTEECRKIIRSLIACGATTNHKISLVVCKNIESIMKSNQVCWSDEEYCSILDLITLHLTSFDKTVCEAYRNLLVHIPLNIVIARVNKAGLLSDNKKSRYIKNYSAESLILAQRLHMRSNIGEMQAQHFKSYMAYLLQENQFDALGLWELFSLCWPTISDNETMAKMYELGLANRSVLFFWAGFEAAQHCVLNKLRTPLGKPQETFTTIEGALKMLAREISCPGTTTTTAASGESCSLDSQLQEHSRVRLFIDFLEHLERVIHNAAEGCAVALPPLSKPVRTFFHTNRSTCREWLNRIRLALCVVSLHAGLASSALRNGQRLLDDLSAQGNCQTAEFERAALCTARAMVMLSEAEALQGLYVYAKDRDRKFTWLKAAVEEAAGKYELAAESYHQVLAELQSNGLGSATGQDSPSTPSSNAEACFPESPAKVTGAATSSGELAETTQVAAFCMERLVKCYRAVCDWKRLEQWKVRETEILEENSCLRRQLPTKGLVLTPQQTTCLRKFECGEELALRELADWQLLNVETDSVRTSWSSAKTMAECSNTLTNIAMRIHVDQMDGGSGEPPVDQDLVSKCMKVAAKTLEESLRNLPSEYLNEAILAQYSAVGLLNLLKYENSTVGAKVFQISQVDKLGLLDSSVLTQILWWSDYFKRSDKSGGCSLSEVNGLRLHVARSARKEGNFALARRELAKYFAISGLGGPGQDIDDNAGDDDHHHRRFQAVVDGIIGCGSESLQPINWTKDNMRAFREMSKLLYNMNQCEEAVKVCSVTALGISRSIVDSGEQTLPEVREVGTKVLLTLGKWIQLDAKLDDNPQLDELLYFESLHNDGLMAKLFGKTTELIPAADIIVGKLVQLGVNQCPDLPTAWSNFAAWCYKWGRKIVDHSGSGLLTDTDKAAIQSLLPVDITESDLDTIYEILSQKNHAAALEDEGDIDTNDINPLETIEQLLRSVPILSCASTDHLAVLENVWRQAEARIYAYYELSANAYFKYLQLAKDANNCETITATLRLLRLVVKHASELQNVLESGLSTTPTSPWKEIIPQLFSRLSHPESYVRTRVSELLCRIAENSPHLITFPAVVGAVSCGQMTSQLQSNHRHQQQQHFEKDNADETVDMDYFLGEDLDCQPDPNQVSMDACFVQLADCLSNRIPDSVDQVKVLVKELRRITLLWDELWLATLYQHHSDISKRFEQLELEVQKVQDNIWLSNEEKETLIAEKHRIIMKPIIFILENLYSLTSVSPETPHEKYFQEKFGACVERVIDKLKNPKNPSRPQTAALPLKQLESKLAQKIHKRGAYSLLMSDISPILANFKDTCIAMPGISTSKMITIKCVENSVQILPTKTKPKKLMFRGSDGQVYTYLFKGLEDLHLDERIMQFLSICNTMMSKNNDKSAKKVYRARHYSVIPLGPRSGLIQWVDGVTPLFALYKRWQQKESAMNGKGGGGVLRPSELFYSKLTPLLKEKGIASDNRKEWPLSILKQVLATLMAETPKDLLAKEIWCNSLNAGSWWQATKNYSYSMAVMSIIGYIIGLGDRHLDNVLVDLNTGEVVHIDYNVCFEKGKTLRVPEKVPFRMTPNIKTALGVTGVEGIFRVGCEATLRVMRRGRETLLTLLEAFVYEPLVDWRAGGDGGAIGSLARQGSRGTAEAGAGALGGTGTAVASRRQQLEHELTQAMFAVRLAEMRAEWLANRQELAAAFPVLAQRLGCWIELGEGARHCQEQLQDRHRQLALVKEAQAMGKSHALYSLVKRYNTAKRAQDLLEQAKLGLQERLDDCHKHISSHNLALSAVRGGQLGRWISELQACGGQEEQLVFELVKEFLQNAGQSQMIAQCEQSESELGQLAMQQSVLVRSCLDLLSQYSAICSLYPLSHMAQHRSLAYAGWAGKLLLQAASLSAGSLEACREVLGQLEALAAPARPGSPRLQRTVAFSYQVQAILGEANDKLTKAYERMITEGLPDALARIDKAHLDSKAQIAQFLRSKEQGADKALECVTVGALCALNKKYLMMEGAAKCAGDCLVDLTSRDGDWFLDEMRLMSSLIVELLSLLPSLLPTDDGHECADPNVRLVVRCLRSADSIHKGLQELNYNFHTIILPEATKTIITEEPTVMRMINELDDVIASTGFSLMEILEQLEMHMRFTIMEMDSPHAIMQNIVESLRIRFEALLSRPADLQELNQEETLTAGQMLLMGFNGLFEKLQMEGNALISTLSSVEIPASWKKIDQVREAKDMTAPIFNQAAREVLEDIFLVKRLCTIQRFFSMCREIAAAFRSEPASVFEGGLSGVYSDEQLNKPIRFFTADYVSRQLIGVTSQSLAIALCFLLQRMGLNVSTEIEQRDIGAESKVPLEELCRKALDIGLKRGLFNGSALAQANALSSALESSWRRMQTAKATQQAVEVARASVQRLQLQLTAHYWLHEDYLLVGSNINLISPLNRASFMLELRKTAAALSSLQARVNEAREQQQSLVQSAVQRLKWAAGANPALSEVMAAFDNAVIISCEKLQRQANLSGLVASTCNSILHYEAIRTRTQESLANDANFVKLVKHWEESCVLGMSLTITVTPVEEGLVELLQNSSSSADGGNIDANWLRQTEKLISEAIVEAQKKLKERQESLATAQQTLREQVALLQAIVAEHHRLMNDVRLPLRSMAKQQSLVGLRDFLLNYRSCTESLSSTVKELESENLEPARASLLKMELEVLAVKTPQLYDELLSFAKPPAAGGGESMAAEATPAPPTITSRAKLVRQDSICLSPRKGVPAPARDPTTGKAVQERNAYALNVWRRVRMKLEGRDPNPNRKYSTAEQVEYVIREAQSIENLALLYEGWTPWV
ncbi:serine/threonine-protein kinase SMG1 [Phymastichus coffea]|uniref:serine/threonine-protein kinase SMG1 n=1 Tax=Phymastichus coffea TaxID=108790 RepID=UPI00273B8422|nr:serine/threonine-protein kinase SMG1 [Phymastichus coffea]